MTTTVHVVLMFKGGADTFISKGTNGRWKDVPTDDELALYKNLIRKGQQS